MSSDHVIIALLIALLAMGVSIGLLLAILAARGRWRQWWRQPDDKGPVGEMSTRAWPGATNARLRPTTWLAVRTTRIEAVQGVLALDDPRPCAWTDGLARDAARRLYVSPPVAGWVLVTGADLPDPAEDIDECFRFLMGLSRQLGHVQYFHRSLAAQHHAWVKLESGRVLRAYAWIGHTAWNQGLPSSAERELGLRSYGYAESFPNDEAEPPEELFANVERLPQLAARWSIDPAAVDMRFWSTHPGISGDYSVPRLL